MADALKSNRATLVFLTPTITLVDEAAHIGQDMVHSEDLELTTPIPAHRTTRWKYRDYTQPPIPDGSEYTIIKSPPKWDHFTQAPFVNRGLKAFFNEYNAEKTHQQLRNAQHKRWAENFIIAICVMTFVAAIIVSIVGSATGNNVDLTPTVEPPPVSEGFRPPVNPVPVLPPTIP